MDLRQLDEYREALEEIQHRIAAELDEADSIIRQLRHDDNPKLKMVGERARLYWYPNMRGSLDNESGFSSPMFTMQDALNELADIRFDMAIEYTLICAKCGTEVELEQLDDVVECPNCGADVSKETCRVAR